MFGVAYEQAVPNDRCQSAFNTHRPDAIQAELPAASTVEPTTTPFFTGMISGHNGRLRGRIPVSASLF